MAIIMLIDSASKFQAEIKEFFKEKYKVVEMTGEFISIRSRMTTTEDGILYVVTGLTKPERYEIFCLARKNGQEFLTIGCSSESTPSDRNVIEVDVFNGEEVLKKLENSKIAPTTANKKSKGICLRSLGELKSIIKRINATHKEFSRHELLFKECEERLIKIWNFNSQRSIEEAEECYKKMIEDELKKREGC